MFSPCFDLAKTKTQPFNHLPLRSNPYMTPDTSVCRTEWVLLLKQVRAARATAEAAHQAMRLRPEATEAEEVAFDEFYKMMRLEGWVEKELAVVKRKKNELGDLILEFMQENKYDAVSADNATILKKSSTRKAGLKEEAILSAAKEFLGEHDVEKFMQKLDSTRETVTKEKINVKVAKQR